MKREVERGFPSSLTYDFHTLLLFYLQTQILRAYARKNHATVEISP